MSVADTSSTTAKVQQQYEALPYPQRDPSDESDQRIMTSLDDLDAVNYYCFRGRRDYRRGFRALVAGGGTGDATLFLARQLAATDAQIFHLDLSGAAIDVACQRARRWGIEKNVSWVQGSLFDLPTLGLGQFDYINCCGVLHHLADPSAGLAMLKSVLRDDGAMGLMLYGRYGRTGIYHLQQLMQLVNQGEDDMQAMVENTREVFGVLPPTNWLKRPGSVLPNGGNMNDSELYDSFLHSSDRPYSVPEVYDLLGQNELNLVEFAPTYRLFYGLQLLFRSERLRDRLDKLSVREQQAAAEIAWGFIGQHTFWASPVRETIADPRNRDNVPRFTQLSRNHRTQESLVNAPAGPWKSDVKFDRVPIHATMHLNMDDATQCLVRLIDGQRTIGQIIGTIAAECPQAGSENDILELCCSVLETLRAFDLVLLRHTSVPAMND